MQLEANVIVDQRFRLDRQLGRGGMGTVWYAWDLSLDKACAIKFIEGEYAGMLEAQARFKREAQAAAKLNSPHVVTIYQHNIWEGMPYIAMELLVGEDLGKRLTRVGRISPQECLEIMGQVARGLSRAHEAGIVHRDLKPDNIFLVRDDDDRDLVKILDFGIAKSASNALEGSNTKTGAMLGTPYYMSPEQAQGIKAVDHRSDLWSLGVIVFQIMTGKLPFESEALGDLLVKIIVTPPPMPSHFVQDLPPAFDEWWRKASQRDPSIRFQTAKELVTELRAVFGQGQSQVTEVMRVVNPPGAGAPGGTVAMSQSGGGFAQSGGGYGQQSPNPYHSPAPYASSQGGYQQPQGMQSSQGGFQPTTGAPVAGTFDGQQVVPQKSRMGLFVGVGAAVVVLGVVVGVAAMKGGGGSNNTAGAGGGATTTATAAASTTTVATATAPPAASARAETTTTVTPPADSATTPPPVPSATAVVATTGKAPPTRGGTGGAAPGGGSHTQTTAAAATTKPTNPKDLGF
jgi:serine/threonine-protein kinase